MALSYYDNRSMGSNRNKGSRNTHRRAYRRRWSAEKYKRRSAEAKEKGSLCGSRIVNLDKFSEFTSQLTTHAAQCGGEIIVSGEKRAGLASIISTRCSKCHLTIPLTTSQKVRGPKGYARWETNLAAVWGQMSTGGGHSKLQETMGTLGVPVMAPKNFINTERCIGEWWQQQLQQSMAEAGKEEKRLAEERGSYHEGVPAITVIVDGGWSKRSHKHSYNAKSGVGVIIGQATGKLLYIGVRNKYCTACTRGIPVDKHECFKNWEQSSSEMEPDIILQGFNEAEATHGVRYMNFVGDGDSSVYSTLIQCVPGWGRYIEKMECANHSCKCYRSALEKLVQEKPQYKGKGGLTEKMRRRLTSAARCAIKMRSQEPDITKAAKKLEKDLLNGPFHCFGQHENCSPDFCKTAKQVSSSRPSEPPGDREPSDSENDLQESANIMEEQERLWNETLTDNPTELGTGQPPTTASHQLMHDIQVAVSRLASKASRLVRNFTTNLAENWMQVRCKFEGGKVVNRSQSGSWQYRCCGAGLQKNLGKTWGPTLWEKMAGHSASQVFVDAAESSAEKVRKDLKRKSTEKSKDSRRRSKYSQKSDNSVAARKAYSRHDNLIEPDDVADDISSEQLEETKTRFYSTQVEVSTESAESIERQTRQQSGSTLWKKERMKRITASNVGAISKMRKTTKRSGKVKELLYSTFRGNQATMYGTLMEDVTNRDYIQRQHDNGHPGLSTEPSGLVINPDTPWLGASPDGRVMDPGATYSQGLVEFKNPFASKDLTIEEASKNKTFCLERKEKIGQVTYSFKQRHNYFYQVQCQMHCCDVNWCDFVVRTEKSLHVERIQRDKKWWEEQVPKLKEFYFRALLPELACPRHGKGGIREPTH